MDAKLGVSLFRWSRRFTWVLCPNCDCGNLGVLLCAASSQQPLWEYPFYKGLGKVWFGLEGTGSGTSFWRNPGDQMPFFSLLFRGIVLLLLEHRRAGALLRQVWVSLRVSLWCRFWRRSAASMTCRFFDP